MNGMRANSALIPPASALAELGHLLQTRAGEPRPAASVLAALARLDPASVADWLLAAPERAEQALSPQQLTEILADVVMRAGTPLPEPVSQATLLGLCTTFAEAVPISAAIQLLRSLGSEHSVVAGKLLDSLLRREPCNAELLRLAADAAIRDGSSRHADALLTRLGRADPRLSTLRHVSRQRRQLPRDLPTVRIAVLSSYTIDPLIPYLELECAELGLIPDVYITPFNAWAQESLSPDSALYRFRPEVIFVALALDDLIPGLQSALDHSELDALGAAAVDRTSSTVHRLAESSDAVVVVHGFFSAYRDPYGIGQGRKRSSRSQWINELNVRLADAIRPLRRAHILDLQDCLLRRSGGPLEHPKLRHYASLRLSEEALAAVAAASAGYLAASKGLTRKCVVLDMDNTLWGGVIGEDGIDGIRLGNTSPGAEYRDFQLYLESLAKRGILLAINSKNNAADALQALRHHEWMVLRESMFSAIYTNWDPKPENMRRIAQDLNIGLDSLIFVDDNPNERELMRQALPQVLTVALPADTALYRQALESLPQLQTLAVTQEDRARVGLYHAQRARQKQRASATGLEDYLRSLAIQVRIAPAATNSLQRLEQLFQRTNQFNLTTRRYSAAELCACLDAPDRRLYALWARDRFGDHGLVATALIRLEQERPVIDSFLMSCRVIGYGIETALLAAVAQDARECGHSHLVGEFTPTEKNAPAGDFYPRHGFAPANADGSATRWLLALRDRPIETPPWISAGEQE